MKHLKENEGQTLLTCIKIAIFALACVAAANLGFFADAVVSLASNAEDTARSFLNENSDTEQAQAEADRRGTPIALYFHDRSAEDNATRYIYQVYYMNGQEGSYGLTTVNGEQILPQQYQDIRVLPAAYALKEAGHWRFYSRSDLSLLSEEAWDSVQMNLGRAGYIETDLLSVSRDGLYGAVDLTGQIVIEPRYDEFFFNSQEVEWPLILVKKDGYYGFIDTSGNVVVDLVYDYAVLNTVVAYEDENDAEGTKKPVIYVRKDDQWGALYRQSNGSPGAVEWGVEPTTEVLAAYQEQLL